MECSPLSNISKFASVDRLDHLFEYSEHTLAKKREEKKQQQHGLKQKIHKDYKGNTKSRCYN